MPRAASANSDHAPDRSASDRSAPTQPAPIPVARFRDVHKRFGSLIVLAGVDLDIQPGTTTVILGPSGSGKSVMLKHLVGLLKPDRGDVFFEDHHVSTLPERRLNAVRRRVGFLFQLSALFDSMTVFDNLAFPLREHERLSRTDLRRRVHKALDTVDLHGVAGKFPAQLSGGQQKRAALARAIIRNPTLMLYDEPTTGLDPVRAAGINQLIRKLQRDLGMTSLVVTHDLASARAVGDRVVLLYNGTLVADGTYDQLDRSDDPRVRGFLHAEPDVASELEHELDHHREPSPAPPAPAPAPAPASRTAEGSDRS